jgi:deazaflavin-dependent oxidoreductase (nitroreductase family)
MAAWGGVGPADGRAQDFSLRGTEHVHRYLETDGQVGHVWNGVTCLVLWTRGRKSGHKQAKPLIYGTRGEDLVIVASYGGAPGNPDWYLNLVADPAVEVQVGADRFAGKARTAIGDERAELWELMACVWPALENYQERTERTIPVVVIKRS